MGNPLTGEFDIVAEFGVDTVNRILAAQHQLSGPDQIYLHSARTIVRADVVEGVWGIAEIQVSPPTISLPAESGPPVVTTVAVAPPPTALTLGFAEEAQPAVGLAPGSDLIFRRGGSRVTLHFDTRVRFRPDSGSASAPEFVHGDLRLTVNADQVVSPVESIVAVNLDADDLVVSFVPDPGAPLSPAERALVAKAARHFIRDELGAVNLRVELPPASDGLGLSHWRYKTLPHDSHAAVALLLNMRPDRVPTQAHRESYDNNFLKSSDSFAFAIGSDFLIPALRDLLEEQIQQELGGRSFSVDIPGPNPKYKIGLAGKPEVTLAPGAIQASISLAATTDSWTPNANLTLTQSIGLGATAEAVHLNLVGDLDLSLSFRGGIGGWVANRLKFLFENRVKNAVSAALVQAVSAAQPLLEETLSGAAALTEKLRIPPPQLTYDAVDISTAGITVHGNLAIAEWEPVVVAFESRQLLPDPLEPGNSQLEYTALKSWIPGGSIRRFRWLLSGSDAPGSGIVDEHRFTMQPAPQVRPFLWGSWCLEVSGVQDGRAVTGSNCGLIGPRVVAWPDEGTGSDAGDNDPSLPVGVWDAAGNLVAHVDVSRQRPGRRTRDPSPANVLVHFAGSEPQATPALLHELLPRLEHEDKGLLVISVIRPGALTAAPANEPLGVPNIQLAWAEDYEGGWARAFQVREGKPAFLVTPPDGLVWRSSAEPEAGELAEALGRYLKPTELPPVRTVRPAVREYERAPNFLFDYIPGTKMKLSTLRGRPVQINFFKSWSQPCLAELRRLQALHERQGERGGVILAVADGEDGQEAQALFERYGYRFRIVADPDRRIARQYGIVAWPTTITVDAGGFVREIRSGASTVPGSSEDSQVYQVL